MIIIVYFTTMTMAMRLLRLAPQVAGDDNGGG